MSSSSYKNLKEKIGLNKFSNEKRGPKIESKSKDFNSLKKDVMNNIYNKYGQNSKMNAQYIKLVVENLMFNRNTHLVSKFKDYMLWDYKYEFLKRFYRRVESSERVPMFSTSYKNYLKFFCIPTFRETFSNNLIHNNTEKKAELFYDENYRKKNENESDKKDCGLLEESESDEELDTKSLPEVEKSIFDETMRKKIEKNSLINTSMPLPDSEANLKDDESGLLVARSNDTTLLNIMTGMNPPPSSGKKKKENKRFRNELIKNKIKSKNNTVVNNNNNIYLIDNKDIKDKISLGRNYGNIINNNKSNRLPQRNLVPNPLINIEGKTLDFLLNPQKRNKIKSGFNKSSQKNSNTNINLKSNPKINNNRNNMSTGLFKSRSICNDNCQRKNNLNNLFSYVEINKKKTNYQK